MNTIRVGLVGPGFVGHSHVEALRRLGYVEVLALAEHNAHQARATADRLGIPEACGDYRLLLAEPRVTVIHNTTPNWMHFQVNRDALRVGKHVVSERPLALTLAQAEQLTALARRSETVNALNLSHRGYPLVRQMRAMIARGDIGQVRLVHGTYLQDWLMYPNDFSWRVLPEEGGASRAVADIGTQWCDLAQWVTGQRIGRVMARLATVVPVRFRPPAPGSASSAAAEEVQVHTEDYGSVLFDLDGGATGCFTVSQVSAGHRDHLSIEVDGSEASVTWHQCHPDELWIGRRGRPSQVLPHDPALLDEASLRGSYLPAGHTEGWSDALRNLMAQIYEFIRAERNPVREKPAFPTFEDGLAQSQLVEAILESARRHTWVDVPAASR